jgi:hypothetical protein
VTGPPEHLYLQLLGRPNTPQKRKTEKGPIYKKKLKSKFNILGHSQGSYIHTDINYFQFELTNSFLIILTVLIILFYISILALLNFNKADPSGRAV